MKWWLFKFLFAVLPLSCFAQLQRHELFLSPDSLARQLTTPFQTEKQKTEAIFRWITDNISYHVRPWRSRTRNIPETYIDDAADTGALKPLSERVAIDVLKKRIAFCDGYARLFKTLCDYAGVRSEVITGYADVGASRRKFSSNHRWNAVYFDSSWHLLDVTWASGYVTAFGDEYVQRYNDHYFLTPAKEFVRDHYPEELQWTLLPQPPSLNEFRFSPFKTNAFVKRRIVSYKPEAGIIEASEGDTLHFEIETNNDDKKLVIVDKPYVDSATIADKTSFDIAHANFSFAGNKILYRYIVASSAVEWLNVVFDDEIVMRYKVNIRKNDTVSK